MSEKRRGLGRGLGALIPSTAPAAGSTATSSRPVDLFFPDSGQRGTQDAPNASAGEAAESQSTAAAVVGAGAEAPARPATDAPETGAVSEDTPVGEEESTGGDAGGQPAPAKRKPAAAKSRSAAPAVDGDNLDLVEVPGAQFAELSVADIHPNRRQPRSVFDEEEMAELVHSVREIGVLQPIVVRKSTESGSEPYELVMGERRWRATREAGLETIPAIIRDTGDDALLRDALLENLHRSQLNPLEEAAAYQQLLEDFGATHEELADRIGRSRPQVSNTIRLLRLPPLVQRRVAAGVITAGHARALLSLPDDAAIERMAQKIIAEGLSVRGTEEAVALYQEPQEPRRNAPRPNARHERLDFLASSLADRLDTNVKITLGARKGKVSIEFASVEDLNRIMSLISPDEE
ncbi:ParB/RepB/Spo0J family partition protein [Sinomonas mesophila]|uniref:ParB/RepB/Spo0J family partition protein n=1 Tax=Sinomonas mesophila TaxID=1531955 RepID=UPI0009860EE1|nr:ParB/RepB/Spo0J family partition protein [Sinomonas mesophila]